MEEGILDGVRIVDASQAIAGPMASRLLAEAGADVIKVEPPEGDRTRRLNPSGFASWNRSKRGVVIDLDDPFGRERLLSLLADADVFINDFGPKRAQDLAMDDAALTRRYPRLVVATVTGFPAGHAEADGYNDDLLVQARLGLMDEVTSYRGGPAYSRYALPSWNAAHLLAAGILARLNLRLQTGSGGVVRTSLAQGFWANMTMLWNRAERPVQQLGPGLLRPLQHSLARLCGDGEYIVQGTADIPAMREALARLDPPGVFEDPDDTSRALLTKPASEWVRLFGEAEEQCMQVLRPGECLRYPQVVTNGYSSQVVDPEFGNTIQPGPPFRTEPRSRVTSGAPVLDPTLDARFESSAHPCAAPVLDGVSERRYPLEGLRVLDFGMFLAGPFGPQCLADMGADVIKVEPITGDRMRGNDMTFVGCQRNKRSLALDLRDPRSRPVLESLVRWADVVHHNLRRPAAAKLALDADSIRAINPDAVFCHVSTYGPDGPMSDWPGVDFSGAAASGWMWEGAGQGNQPIWYPWGYMDFQCAFSSLVATLLGLYRRTATGLGSQVSASLLGAATNTTDRLLLADGPISEGPTLDSYQTGISPGYRIYECIGGWIAVGADINSSMRELRIAAGVDRDDELPEAFLQREAAEMEKVLSEMGVPTALVALDQREEFFDDSRNSENGWSVKYEHPNYGSFEQPGAYWSFGDLGVRLAAPPPTTGQHSRQVLLDIGVPPATVDDLFAQGVVVTDEPARR
ncbi:CoA transferase [Jatrophihabitans sp. DSM 45814]